MIGWVFALGGAIAGVAQAGLLARAARSRPNPLSIFVRLLLVGAVFVIAARAGHVASGGAGWIVGFVAAGAVVCRRLQ